MAASGEGTKFRRSATLLAVTAVAALGVLLEVAYGLTGAPRARPVSYVGGWDGQASSQGPVWWTGERAYAACNWFYHKRALIELDPERAEATVLYRWELDDGNTPDLRILQRCGEGQLFVVAETQQTTVVTRRGGQLQARVASVPGEQVLGAACEGDAVELFVERAEGGHALMRSQGDAFVAAEPLEAAGPSGSLLAAWRQGSAWHVIAQDEDREQISAGPIGGAATVIGQGAGRVCAVGAPGGWLFVAGTAICANPEATVSRHGNAFRLEPNEHRDDARVVYQGREPRVGYASGDGTPLLLRGLGELDLELSASGGEFVALRPAQARVAVAKASYSALAIGARALPLSGDRVAIWGAIGQDAIILGPDLTRSDGPSAPAQLMSAVRFGSSTTSLFDVIGFYLLSVASLIYLVLLALAARRRGPPDPAPFPPGLAWGYLLLFAVCVRSVYHVVSWL